MDNIKRACHFQIEAETKWIKIKSVMKKFIYLQKPRTKGFHDNDSLLEIHIYIHISIRKPNKETV